MGGLHGAGPVPWHRRHLPGPTAGHGSAAPGWAPCCPPATVLSPAAPSRGEVGWGLAGCPGAGTDPPELLQVAAHVLESCRQRRVLTEICPTLSALLLLCPLRVCFSLSLSPLFLLLLLSVLRWLGCNNNPSTSDSSAASSSLGFLSRNPANFLPLGLMTAIPLSRRC